MEVYATYETYEMAKCAFSDCDYVLKSKYNGRFMGVLEGAGGIAYDRARDIVNLEDWELADAPTEEPQPEMHTLYATYETYELAKWAFSDCDYVLKSKYNGRFMGVLEGACGIAYDSVRDTVNLEDWELVDAPTEEPQEETVTVKGQVYVIGGLYEFYGRSTNKLHLGYLAIASKNSKFLSLDGGVWDECRTINAPIGTITKAPIVPEDGKHYLITCPVSDMHVAITWLKGMEVSRYDIISELV